MAEDTIKLAQGEVERYGEALIYWGAPRTSFAAAERPVRKEVGKPTASRPYAKWYEDSNNLEPLDILEVLTNSNISPGILATKVDFVIGNGLKPYIERIVDGKKSLELVDLGADPRYADVKAFFEANDINETLRNAATDEAYFGNIFLQFLHRLDGKIGRVEHVDATTMRAEMMTAGRIEHYYYSPDWVKKFTYNEKDEKNPVRRRQAYNPSADGVVESIFHSRRYMPGHPYYALPAWYGAINWIRLANEIPLWHLMGIRNGYQVKYLVEVNENYFATTDPKERQKAKEQLRTNMDSYLAGADNSQKTVFTTVPPAMWEKGMVRITPIGGELNDAAFTVLFQQSNQAMTSAHGIDPTLAGIETSGKLSSGSEKRIAYMIYMILKTRSTRELLLKPIRAIAKHNGWPPELQWGFEDISLSTLDQNPTGSQTVIAG